MNLGAFSRLIDNIEAERIEHDQNTWMQDHTDVFKINPDNRWTCATSACAAGFVWLQEAPDDSIFALNHEKVYTPEEFSRYFEIDKLVNMAAEAEDWDEENRLYEQRDTLGVRIDKWAADVIGIDSSDSAFVFYNFDGTDETLRRLKHLMNGGHYSDYAAPGYDPDSVVSEDL